MAKKKYEVTFYFHTNVTVSIEAENEQDAKLKAATELTDDEYVQQILDGLQEDDSPDVEEVKEEENAEEFNCVKEHEYKGNKILEYSDGVFLATALDADGDVIEKKCDSADSARNWIDKVQSVIDNEINDNINDY